MELIWECFGPDFWRQRMVRAPELTRRRGYSEFLREQAGVTGGGGVPRAVLRNWFSGRY
jgi:hypothetical protein